MSERAGGQEGPMQEVIEIPCPNYPDETPAEALADILRNTLELARDAGGMSDQQICAVLEELLLECLGGHRTRFKVLGRSEP